VWLADISLNEDTGGSVILWITSAGATLPRSMLGVSQSFSSLLQKNVRNRRAWNTREELRIAIVTWIERTYHRRRRQAALGRLTPVEYELIITRAVVEAA
jgi:putative transposase